VNTIELELEYQALESVFHRNVEIILACLQGISVANLSIIVAKQTKNKIYKSPPVQLV
jgi:hypothetical protein